MITESVLNSSVKDALRQMVPLLHYMRRSNLLEVLDNADIIRASLSVQDHVTLISMLITIGEL